MVENSPNLVTLLWSTKNGSKVKSKDKKRKRIFLQSKRR
jgi:hypothetical protein